MTESGAAKEESVWAGRINRATALVTALAGLVAAAKALWDAMGG